MWRTVLEVQHFTLYLGKDPEGVQWWPQPPFGLDSAAGALGIKKKSLQSRKESPLPLCAQHVPSSCILFSSCCCVPCCPGVDKSSELLLSCQAGIHGGWAHLVGSVEEHSPSPQLLLLFPAEPSLHTDQLDWAGATLKLHCPQDGRESNSHWRMGQKGRGEGLCF